MDDLHRSDGRRDGQPQSGRRAEYGRSKSDTLVSIENLIGTNFNDALAGKGSANVLTGLRGNDIVAEAGVMISSQGETATTYSTGAWATTC